MDTYIHTYIYLGKYISPIYTKLKAISRKAVLKNRKLGYRKITKGLENIAINYVYKVNI